MVIGHWTHLATLVLVGPCRAGSGQTASGPCSFSFASASATANPASSAVSNVPMPRCCPLREPGGM